MSIHRHIVIFIASIINALIFTAIVWALNHTNYSVIFIAFSLVTAVLLYFLMAIGDHDQNH